MSESDTPTPDQKPSVGRVVHVPMPRSANNGADFAPAIVTRVWDDEVSINVRILADSTASLQEWRTSLTYVEELPDGPIMDETSLLHWTWPKKV
ncbi:hypothetical protein [Streptomyces sp. NPDC006285]|uniref:hypothetical protein n=1 Tax=Streptomyces sp. NPDC006285 TaxID=3364742 RepID=UPI003688AC63